MNSPRKSHPLAGTLAALLVVFLVLFPKGGIKLGPLPITWGYLLLGVAAPPLLLVRLLALPLSVRKTAGLALLSLVPFQLLFLYAGEVYGVDNAPFTVSTATNLFALPLLFLYIFPAFLSYVDGRSLSFWLRWSIVMAAAWGIFLFFWHTSTGHYIEIPYLTVNAGDYGELEQTKHIARGNFFKLISTYNNGNLYGVCMLILLPLFNALERSFWRRSLLKLALLMTLSRSVWVGMVLEQMLSIAVLGLKQIPTFPRVYLDKAGKRITAVVLTVIFVLFGLLFNSSSLAFLFDSTAGGRTSKVAGFGDLTWLPSRALYGFDEVLYFSAAQYWGYLGFLAFLLMMIAPLLLLLKDRTALEDPLRRAALKGLVLYIFLAVMDGAYNFIPTMAFYYFAFMIYLFGWPSFRAAVARTRQTVHLSPAQV